VVDEAIRFVYPNRNEKKQMEIVPLYFCGLY
jgi:hypothetical protein